MTFLSGSRTRLNNLPASVVRSAGFMESAGLRLRAASTAYVAVYDQWAVSLSCNVMDIESVPADAFADRTRRFDVLFALVANSMVLRNQWK